MTMATGDLEGALRAALGPDRLVSRDGDRSRYLRDWSGDHLGDERLIVRPVSTSEVVEIVRIAAAMRVPIVPQGGHTGLVGGATPSAEGTELVVSLERMNRIRRIDTVNYSLVAEAGCILESVHAAAAAKDLYFPLSLGAQGSCQIGGNVATNAGGVNVLRYGMMRDLVLGLEVVLPDGKVFEDLKALRKDNTGYDLTQLFIGAEGTLGIVTAAALKLFPMARQRETALVGLATLDSAIALHAHARRELGDLLSACELMTRRGIELALVELGEPGEPFEPPAPFYLLLEVSTSAPIGLRMLLEAFLAEGLERGMITNGVLASTGAQAAKFWRLREGLIEAQVRRGRHLRTDVSVSISSVPKLITMAEAAIADFDAEAVALSYGHIGDGNIHLNVVPPARVADTELEAFLRHCEEIIFAIVDDLEGSISAEHGIGVKKQASFLQRSSPVTLDLMHRIKATLDPDNIMNPGRVIPRRNETR